MRIRILPIFPSPIKLVLSIILLSCICFIPLSIMLLNHSSSSDKLAFISTISLIRMFYWKISMTNYTILNRLTYAISSPKKIVLADGRPLKLDNNSPLEYINTTITKIIYGYYFFYYTLLKKWVDLVVPLLF